ncbi:M14 family metallopeptidase [Amycolatopsis magusensis]|uniref:Intracellular protease/amidase n=1 Tax=Amycolatopsis magusensis TaxID=882444 RepID=A0ABS4PRG1_9PSEU|nr:M14 family metallopeptidase [Amycolatopsis magusensis]MBP2181449.1 putative intracellular protease/amidase [Amycolatopsis magusensis]
MSFSRSARARMLAALALVVGLAATTAPAQAAPEPPPPGQSHRQPGYGPERNEVAATDAPPQLRAATAGENRQRGDHRGYPRQTELRAYPADPSDKSIKLGLSPYHALAPKLNELQQRSDRVSVEVAGQSGLGRDLYLVTLTAPEHPAQSWIQDHWRDKIENDPGRAARDAALRAGYKTPVWINNNIHGNEWEGTDGALRVIEYLATTTDKAALDLLKRNRVYLNLTANPDGRVAGTRANASGFDMNRDFVTASQPETRAMREMVLGKQPVMMLDEHGYVENTLIEPTTPPHGQNYDFDLYIEHGYANGLAMEKAVQALGHPEAAKPEIPFRDYEPGVWDGWAPIYTAQYSMYHGAVSYTIEIPQRVNNDAYNLPAAELQRRSKINTDVVEATIRTTIDYADTHRSELIDNQIEIFRRGAAGEPQRQLPDGFVPGFGPEDRYTTEFPRAYVLPAGAGQRSAPAAARLVDHLVANDVRVQRADRDFRLAGKSYPAGSYIVDMHQPKRALANVMLETGADISGKVEVMYDISGWSHRLLWGASVDISKTEAPDVRTTPVTVAAPTGAVDAAPGQDLALSVTDGKDVLAVNTLLGQGRPVHQQADGSVVVPASERVAVLEVAKNLGVRFTAAPAGERGPVLRKPVIAGAVAADELLVLRELGFEVRPVSTQVLNNGFDLSRVDALFVSSGLSYTGLNPAAQQRVKDFLARGGVVTRGATGAAFNAAAGLLPVTAVAGREDANGVVSVTNGTGPIATGAPESSFVYSPLWFTELGAGVTAEQRYAEQNPLAAGHWLPNEDGQGPAQAAGAAAVVSGVDESGAKAVLFGTEPLFRAHPKGLYAQVGRAVFWAATR